MNANWHFPALLLRRLAALQLLSVELNGIGEAVLMELEELECWRPIALLCSS